MSKATHWRFRIFRNTDDYLGILPIIQNFIKFNINQDFKKDKNVVKAINQKNVKEILLLLNKEEELQFSEIQSILELHKGNLSTTLKELEQEDIVSRREEREDKRIPKAYFKLTEFGKKIMCVYELEDKLQSEKESGNVNINVKNNHGIVANNIQNLNVKK